MRRATGRLTPSFRTAYSEVLTILETNIISEIMLKQEELIEGKKVVFRLTTDKIRDIKIIAA